MDFLPEGLRNGAVHGGDSLEIPDLQGRPARTYPRRHLRLARRIAALANPSMTAYRRDVFGWVMGGVLAEPDERKMLLA